MSFSNKPTGDTNELAKERNRVAAERTLTSWIQNCLILITFFLYLPIKPKLISNFIIKKLTL